MKRQPPSRAVLLAMTLARVLAGLLLFGALLFVPAGTIRFWEAWVYVVLTFVPMAVLAFLMLAWDPARMERRMRLREGRTEQKRAIAAMSVLLLAILIIAGLDRRYSWSTVPTAVVLIADALVVVGYVFYGLTIRENRYASRVVEIQQNQVVISTGPYSIVRHPMYLGASLMFGLAPLALGSYWGLIPAILFPLMLAARLKNEEQLLRESLQGYDDYTRKVKYRLVPFVW